MQVLFNDSGNAAAVAGLMFDKANTLLTIQGDIAGSNLNVENANITGNIGVNKVVATGNVEGSNIVTLGVVSTQSGITTGANLAITSISGTGSFVTVNFATQTSIPFASGDTITISGVLPTTYNGTWTVATGTTSLITFASSLTTTATVTSARIKGNGNTTINGILNVVGNTSIGNITAVNSITGNTIVLSGNVDSGNLIASGIIRVTGTANLGAVFSPGDSNVQNSTVRGSFGATGAATFAGTITATADASFYANVLANSNMSVVGGLTASTANIANFRITTGGNVVGNIFTATLFSGNGANITFINGANVTGVVPQASSASTATIAQTAWAVAGANVSGTVASASYSTTAGSATSATTATTASAVAASGITGQTGMWTSTNRPGPYRLYRRDDDSNYSVQHHYTGSYWLLRGYNGDAYHAGCQVAYADSAGSATSAGSVPWSGVTGKPDTSSSIQYSSFGVGTAASGTAGEIRATNNITAYYSDDSLKTNLGTIENALDKIDQLTGFYYEENDLAVSLGYPRKRQVGLSAQTMKKVMPEIVTGAPIDPERFLTIWYEKTAPLLVEGIKELRREINKIKKHIDLE
jgi:cytoskeletal protein CcmA (bactofilin family)